MRKETTDTIEKTKRTWCRLITRYGCKGKANRDYFDPIDEDGFGHFRSMMIARMTAAECQRLVRWLDDTFSAIASFDAFPASRDYDIEDHRIEIPEPGSDVEEWTVCAHGCRHRKISKVNLETLKAATMGFAAGITTK